MKTRLMKRNLRYILEAVVKKRVPKTRRAGEKIIKIELTLTYNNFKCKMMRLSCQTSTALKFTKS